jgi:23S rRNA (adenine2030-N6)-methyltransferase
VKYRHSFHAGNFADVHKHVALLALLRAMQRKDRGLLYLDTHAGAGSYDLAAAATRKGAEARGGILRLAAHAPLRAPELRDYLQAVQDWQHHNGGRHSYPGSAVIAARALRPQDRALCCELSPGECRALERALAGVRRVRIECGDGYQRLQSSLPAPERRSLLLIDPPYETPAAEWDQARRALELALTRQANVVAALWYPIKDEHNSRAAQRLERELAVPVTRLELWLYPRDACIGLNGSGLLIVQPPHRFQERATEWQRELWSVLDTDSRGGNSVHGTAASNPSGAAAAGAAGMASGPRHHAGA